MATAGKTTRAAGDTRQPSTRTTLRVLERLARLAQVLSFLAMCAGATAAPPRFVPGQILIKPRTGLPEPEFAARLRVHGAGHRQTLRHINVRVINVSEDRAEAVLAALRSDPGIEFAERDGIGRTAFLPNDPYAVSGDAWHLAKIQAPQAWDLTTGSPTTVVAILDSGINGTHPDLAGQVLPGYDFLSNGTDTSDDFGHGTAVAGVVVAAGNNSVGVAGVAYGCRVLPVRVVDASGFAAYSAIADGVRYAVEHGARVINISIAGDSPSSTLQDAMNYAWSNNVVVVAAAGNTASTAPQYPAACDHVLAVSGTEPDDTLAGFSTYGSFVGISAPSDGIWTTQRDLSNPYASGRGTSFASPIVAGVAALVASANPALSNEQIVSLLESTADDLGPAGYDTSFGHGRVNAFRALSVAAQPATNAPPLTPPAEPPAVVPVAPPAAPPPEPAPPAAPEVPPTVVLASPTDGTQFNSSAPVSMVASVFPGTSTVTNVAFLVSGLAVANSAEPPFTAAWSPDQQGSYELIAVATDGQGLCSTSAPVRISISLPQPGTPPPDGTGKLTVQIIGLGRVTPDLTGRQLQIGKAYTVKAVAGPGQIFAGWEGAPAQPSVLSFVMLSNLNVTAIFVPSPFPAVEGSYAGLVTNAESPTIESLGCFRLTVTGMGRFSGRLQTGGEAHGFRGQFDLAGNAVVSVWRDFGTPLTLTLRVDLTNGTDTVSGSVSDGTWSSQLAGGRNVFSASENPAPQAGKRSFALERNSDGMASWATGLSDIASGGRASVRGRLWDGRKFGTASSLAKSGDYPFYLSLNRGSEVVIGWLNFPSSPGVAASGKVLWVGTGTNPFTATLQAAPAP